MIEDVRKMMRSALHHIYTLRQAEILMNDASAEEVDKLIADFAQEELRESAKMDMEDIAVDALEEILMSMKDQAEEKPSTTTM